MKKQLSFRHLANELVLRIIKTRRFLIIHNLSRDNSPQMQNTLDEINRLFLAYPHRTDEQIANFVYTHSAEIAVLIPGVGAACHDKLVREFDDLLMDSVNLVAKHRHHLSLTH